MKRSLLIAILFILLIITMSASGCAMKRDPAYRGHEFQLIGNDPNGAFNQNIGQYDRWLIEMGITPTPTTND